MPYDPQTQFQPGLISQGFQGLGQGVSDMIKKQKDAEAQMAGAQIHFDLLKKSGLMSPEEITQFNTGNANQRNAIVTAAAPRLLQKFQDASLAHEQSQTDLLKQQIAASQDAMKDSPYANQPIWMTHPQTGEAYQAGVYDEKGTPHFVPYGGMGAQQMFTPDDVTRKAFADRGYIWKQTSAKAGNYVNLDAGKPDLDANGNPMFTPDGTAYVNKGQVKPLTPEMTDARKAWAKKQQAAQDAAGPHWTDRFTVPPDVLSQTDPSAQATAPAATPAPPAAGGVGSAPVDTPLQSLARQALNDPNASDAHRAAARKILSGQ
jgi:hypothetical protein